MTRSIRATGGGRFIPVEEPATLPGAGGPRHALPPGRNRSSTRNSLIASSSGLASGLLNAAVLALSARDGQTGEIAAYTVVTAALTLVGIAVAGGSPLLYISGDAEQRRAVRSQWVFLTLPSMAVGTVAIGAFYSRSGYEWPAMLAVGAVAVGNNLAALQLGDLARELRFIRSALVICGCKVPALLMVVTGARLTTALLVATVVQFLVAEACLGRHSWLRPARLTDLSPRRAMSVFGMNRHLFTYTIAEFYSGRVTTVALSLIATPRVMGAFGAVISVYQALGGVLLAALRVSLVGRVRIRQGIGGRTGPDRQAELVAVLGATVMAVVTAVGAPWISGELLRLPDSGPAVWLILLAVALPFMTVARAATLNLIGDADYGTATRIMLLNAALISPLAIVAVPLAGPMGAAVSTLGAEVLTVAALGLPWLRRRGRWPAVAGPPLRGQGRPAP
ncbi:hypothetical protein ABZ570_10485 [Micromonospora sp. NPDC007271]|uniref:hypothetical protein n=1 Tax=Micromonospora sp. NPDC007271 TaxID=3154587 RepID=UPI0033F6EC0E